MEKVSETRFTTSAIAGGISGCLTRFLCQPFDVLKIKFQLQVEPISKTSNISKYRAVVQASSVIWRDEGLRGFWRGHNAGQILSITYGFANFAAFESLTQASDRFFSTGSHPVSHFVSGLGSGAVATLASYPFDTIRTRFVAQASNLNYRNMANGLVLMVKNEGVTSPYKGLSPSLLQGALLSGLNFVVYKGIKSSMEKHKFLTNGRSESTLGNFIAGCASGFSSKLIVYPLDLARKRMQFQGFQHARIGYGLNFTCWGLINCLQLTYTKEGLHGLFKGLSPSLIKAVVTTGLHFMFYQQALFYLGKIG